MKATRTDKEDALPDLLCNLMHAAKQDGIDFLAMLNRGAYHWQAEIEIEEAGEEDMVQEPLSPFHFVRMPGPCPK
jgi:hypothetical protein